MEQNLIVQQQSLSRNTVLSETELQICSVLYPINHLKNFPITETELEELSMLVTKYLPDVTIDQLQQVMDNFFQLKLKYDHRLGVYQNIVIGLHWEDPNVYREVNNKIDHSDR